MEFPSVLESAGQKCNKLEELKQHGGAGKLMQEKTVSTDNMNPKVNSYLGTESSKGLERDSDHAVGMEIYKSRLGMVLSIMKHWSPVPLGVL